MINIYKDDIIEFYNIINKGIDIDNYADDLIILDEILDYLFNDEYDSGLDDDDDDDDDDGNIENEYYIDSDKTEADLVLMNQMYLDYHIFTLNGALAIFTKMLNFCLDIKHAHIDSINKNNEDLFISELATITPIQVVNVDQLIKDYTDNVNFTKNELEKIDILYQLKNGKIK